MKMIDVLNEARAKNASKVFVNPEDAKELTKGMAFLADIKHCFEPQMPGLNWYADKQIERGTFRVE